LGYAEKTELKDNSVDLVVVAEALHWLEIDKFFAECDRILKPGGVIAVSMKITSKCCSVGYITRMDLLHSILQKLRNYLMN
jgi:ubiquinone/menaquinone biosynthesis C-methylase UbiE